MHGLQTTVRLWHVHDHPSLIIDLRSMHERERRIASPVKMHGNWWPHASRALLLIYRFEVCTV